MTPRPPSLFEPVPSKPRNDAGIGLGFVLGVAVVLFGIVLLLVFSFAWFG